MFFNNQYLLVASGADFYVWYLSLTKFDTDFGLQYTKLFAVLEMYRYFFSIKNVTSCYCDG